MGWAQRVIACGAALPVAACAMIAGLEDPKTDDLTSSTNDGSVQNTSSGGSSSSASSTSGASSSSGSSSSGAPSDASSSGDAMSDAPIDTGPTCALFKLGDTCKAASECCSNTCNEERKCATECKGGGSFGCDPTSTSSCCVGYWCTLGQCAACINPGQPAAQPAGFPYPPSCCSRAVMLNGNCQ